MIAQSEQQNTISIFDLLLEIADVKDCYSFLTALHGSDVIAANAEIITIRANLVEIIQFLTKSLGDCVYQQGLNAVKNLQAEGMSDALSLLGEYLTEIKRLQAKLSASLINRDILTDPLIGMQLFHFLSTRKIKHIGKIESARNCRKFDSTQNENIETILVAFKSDHDICHLVLSLDEATVSALKTLKQSMLKLIDTYDLKIIKKAFHSFKELLSVNQTLIRWQLDQEEIDHIGFLITQYYQNNQGPKLSPEVAKFIYSLPKIKPIFDVQLIDLSQLLESVGFQSRSHYVVRNFAQASSQVYKTYEGLAQATACYEELDKLFLNFIEGLGDQQVQTVAQIKKYRDCISRYFQLTMRFALPMNEFIEACSTLKEKLNGRDKALATLNRVTSSLQGCSDLLRQKSLSINALKDISNYIKEIDIELLTSANQRMLFPPTINFSRILIEIKTYFTRISQSSRTEDHTNYHAILDTINTIFSNNKFVIKPTENRFFGCSNAEKLVAKIHRRFEENVATFQADFQADGLPNVIGNK
jgi:hypothetical protein